MAMTTRAAPQMHPALVPDRIDDAAILANDDGEPVWIRPHVGDPVGWLQDPRIRGQVFFVHGVVGGNTSRSRGALRNELLSDTVGTACLGRPLLAST